MMSCIERLRSRWWSRARYNPMMGVSYHNGTEKTAPFFIIVNQSPVFPKENGFKAPTAYRVRMISPSDGISDMTIFISRLILTTSCGFS